MKIYGPEVAEGSRITNITVPSGTSFPTGANIGELFYRSDSTTLFIHSGSTWDSAIGGTFVDSSGDTMTGPLVISTASPLFTLKDSDNVLGNSLTGMLQFTDSADVSAGYVGYSVGSDSDFYVVNELSGGKLKIGTVGNTDSIVIDSLGNVGVGTDSPILDAGGGISIVKSDTASLSLKDSTTNSLAELSYADTGASSNCRLKVDPGNIASGNPYLSFEVSGNEGLRVTDTALVHMYNSLDMNGTNISNIADPTTDSHVMDRGYADLRYVNVTGDTINGDLTIASGAASLILKDSNSTSPTAAAFVIFQDSTGTQMGYVGYGSSSNEDLYLSNNTGVGKIQFQFNSSTKFYIDGNILAGWETGGPALMNEVSSNINPTILPNSGDTDTGIGQNAIGELSLINNGTESIRIQTNGTAKFNSVINASDLRRDVTNSSVNIAGGTNSNVGGNITIYGSTHASLANIIRFRNGPTETMRISESGQVSIESVIPVALDINAPTNGAAIRFQQNGTTRGIIGVSGAIEGDTSTDLGIFSETGSGLRVYVNGSATEVMSISTLGHVGLHTAAHSQAPMIIQQNYVSDYTLILESVTAFPYGMQIRFPSSSPDNNSQEFLNCSDSTTVRARIYSDGDMWTSDAGTLTSDQTLKNNITDASPKLSDLMNLQVRNFYWDSSFHPVKNTKKMIGFIAQEVETIFPSLISEHDIAIDNATYDDDGNELTPHVPNMKKAIKDAFAPILVKAVQELKTEKDTEIQALQSKNDSLVSLLVSKGVITQEEADLL